MIAYELSVAGNDFSQAGKLVYNLKSISCKSIGQLHNSTSDNTAYTRSQHSRRKGSAHTLLAQFIAPKKHHNSST